MRPFPRTLQDFASSHNTEFGTYLDEALRDRLVCGIHSSHMQKRLLSEDKLTFKRALELALAMETAAEDTKFMTDQSMPAAVLGQSEEVHRATNQRTSKTQGRKSCYRCGNPTHLAPTCPHRTSECKACGKMGHLATVCRSRLKRVTVDSSFQAKHVSEDQEECVVEDDATILTVSNARTPPLLVSLKLDGKDVTMELDTGASVSLMLEEQWRSLQLETPMEHSQCVLRTYTGEVIPTCGRVHVEVHHNGQTRTLPLLIVQNTGPALFGRNWLSAMKLDWHNIQAINSEPWQATLRDTLDRYEDLFKPGLGTMKDITATIHLKPGTIPRFLKYRTVPYAIQEMVETELARMEHEGILEKVDSSPWATPLVCVRKKDGKVRLCGDYKLTINQGMDVDTYPLPRPEELIHKLAGGTLFTTLDLSQAYQQMRLDKESQEYTTINTHKGLYRYTRVPFGISSAPAKFQRAMEQILHDLKGVGVFIDDLLITGNSVEDHMRNLNAVLTRLREYGLRLRQDKCRFLQPSVEFLGQRIDNKGVHVSQAKVDSILQCPPPENVAQLQSFLGMVQYHSRFLPNLSTLLQPVTALLQKGQTWAWTKQCEQAFQTVKQKLTSAPVLTTYNPDLELRLATDASPYGVGAVLTHHARREGTPPCICFPDVDCQ